MGENIFWSFLWIFSQIDPIIAYVLLNHLHDVQLVLKYLALIEE
jgi:hypothetical protein